MLNFGRRRISHSILNAKIFTFLGLSMLGTLKIDEAVAAFIHLAFVWDLKKHKVLIFTLLFKKITFYKKKLLLLEIFKTFSFQEPGILVSRVRLRQVLGWTWTGSFPVKFPEVKWYEVKSDQVILKILRFSDTQNSLIQWFSKFTDSDSQNSFITACFMLVAFPVSILFCLII